VRLLTVGRLDEVADAKRRPHAVLKGEDHAGFTSDFNMVPGEMMGTAALTGTTGGGTQFAGIVRASSAQAGEESFGQWWQWRSALGRKGLRTLTVGIATG